MKKLFKKVWLILLPGIFLVYLSPSYAQNISKFQYINPLPNSSYVSIGSNIIIRQGNVINKNSLNDNLIEAFGTKSGIHKGRINLADDSKTIIFTPFIPFQTDEEVTVKLKDGLITSDGTNVGSLSFKFHTYKNANTLIHEEKTSVNKSFVEVKKLTVTDDSLFPPDLPQITIRRYGNPAPGYIFLTPMPYLLIVDNEGTPVFYRNTGGTIYDFDLQPDGEMTYFLYPVDCYGMDKSLNITRKFNTTNGYSVDVHDLLVLPNGSYYIFGKKVVYMNLSKVVNGGNPNATVIEGALQEFDSTGNLIFQWDALDHYKITDVDSYVDLTQPTIDFSHFNSVAIDTDGDLLISARNLDEITKVDPKTGNIIWRLGGNNNQFKFINDNTHFSRQHDIRVFSNGDISLFDNGVYESPQVSSAVEYKLDEKNKTATLIYRITYDDIFTPTEGSVQELSNGNRLIEWGHNWDPVITEVTPDDSFIMDVSYPRYFETYRGFKYNWQTDLFTTNTDSLDFKEVKLGDSLSMNITVHNPKDTSVVISEFYSSDSSFYTTMQTPIILKPKDSITVPVIFKPLKEGIFNATFNIRNFGKYDTLAQMIAKQVFLSGRTEIISSVNSNVGIPGKFILSQNYPNPFNPSTIISYQVPKSGLVTLKIYDVLGREVKTLVSKIQNPGKYKVKFDASNFASGLYLYRLSTNNFTTSKKMILLK